MRPLRLLAEHRAVLSLSVRVPVREALRALVPDSPAALAEVPEHREHVARCIRPVRSQVVLAEVPVAPEPAPDSLPADVQASHLVPASVHVLADPVAHLSKVAHLRPRRVRHVPANVVATSATRRPKKAR